MDLSDTKTNSSKEDLIKRLLEKVESANNEDIIKMLSAVEDTSTAENKKTANETKKELQPSTSYASNENINKKLLPPNTQQKSRKIAGKPNKGQRTNMFGDIKMYGVRGGTANSGRDYEFKMLTLLCIRCFLEKAENMWIATNAKGVGEFDDIICYFKAKGRPGITYMIQMKHEEAQSQIKQEDFTHRGKPFNLIKHALGFSKLKETLVNTTGSGDVIDNLDPDKIVSVFFTNRVAANTGIPYFKDCTNEDLMILNTSVENKHLYKFDVTVGRALGLTNLDYCKNIYFLSNQVNETDMNICIFEEMKKVIKELHLIKINAHSITKDFIEYITKQAKCKGKKRQHLTQDRVLYKLTDLFLSQYVVKFNNELDTFCDCPNKKIWKKIVDDKKITYVAFDKVTFKFLKEYVSSEVKKYYDKLTNKYSNLSNENQKSFFHKNSHFETILGKQGTPTILDVYKCMWVDNKIPLILEINNKEEHQQVLSILNWSKLDLKIVIINKLKLTLPTWSDTKVSFINLNDLNAEHRRLILDKSVRLQGRKNHKLGELINESMYEFIKCNDIIHILTGNYNIGNNYSSVQYFIERSMYKILIKFEALKVIKDEAFIIHDQAAEGLLINKLENLNLKYSTPNLLVCQDITKEDIKELKSKYKTIHRLIFDKENWLEWVESQGETKRIKKHLVKINNSHSTIRFHDKIRDDVLTRNVLNNIHVFSGCPGMGKSTLMDFISNKAPTNMWVLKITLNDHTEHYETAQFKEASDNIKYFNEKIINDGSCFNIPLAEAVFQKLLTKNKILVLLDGFDEVSVSYKDEATKIMKTFYESGYCMWMSTRPHMNSHLEEEFDTIAITITPFTLQDQHNFFIEYFTQFIQNSPKCEVPIDEFIKKLFKAAEKNLNDWDREVMEIPLQCKLLADFFIDDLKASLSQNAIKLNEDFDLLELYEDFMNKKKNILCNKYGKYAKEMHKFFDYYQKLLALKIIFRKSDLCELDIDLELSNYYQNKKNCMEFLQREGVLVVHKKKKTFGATFVHRTFAEFIVGQWLAENYDSTNSKIKNTVDYLLSQRFSSGYNYRFLFRIFDSLFGKGFPLHSAIINKQIPQIKKILASSAEDINKLDKCKRSILHLIALYADTNISYDYKIINRGNSITLDQMLDIIEIMPAGQVTDLCGKDSFEYTPVDYAFLSNCFPIADKLCQKSNEIMTISWKYFFTHNSDYAYIVYKFPLNKRFQYLLRKSIYLDLHDNLSFLFAILKDEDRYLEKLDVLTATDLIEKFTIKSASENYYSDLRFAAAFGTLDNVKQLLAEGADVNQRVFGYTCLYCAVKKNRPEIVEILHEIAEVNAICVDGNTVLHAASEAGYGNLVEILIKSGANINKRNEFGETPLFFACKRNADNIVNLLLQHRADVNIINKIGNTCLHVAAEKGFQKLIHKFIQLGMDVNTPNFFGRTSLFLALESTQTDVANLLIKEDIKVDTIDSRGVSYLHLAAEADQSYLVSRLINAGLDVNKQNDDGETSLSLAVRKGHMVVVELLLKNNAKIDEVDKHGNTCLHAAAEADQSHVVGRLINAGLDINKQNKTGRTPLSLAVKNGHVSVVELLLKNNAKIDGVDSFGNTCLHAAAVKDQSHVVSRLINAGVDVNKQNRYGETPLSLALKNAHVSIVELLLKYNAKIVGVDRHGNTCLHAAALTGQNHIVSRLINAGLDVNKQNHYGETPLSFAVRNGHIDVIELLLKNNAKMDKVDGHGNTCLHAAALTGQSHVVSRLINAGLDINKQNRCGATPLSLALKNAHVSVVELLLKHNAKIEGVDRLGNTCLHAAAHTDKSHVVSRLINAGVDVNKQNLYGETPLSIALKNGHITVIELLLKNNAYIEGVDNFGNTYLHAAALTGQSHVVSRLINAGLDVNKQNRYGATPLSIALKNGHISVIELLLKNNSKIDGVDRFSNTCLHAAAEADQSDVVSQLINAGLDVNKQYHYGETSLSLAHRFSNSNVIETPKSTK